MKRLVLLFTIIFASISAAAQQPAWNLTMREGLTASSNIAVVNQCQGTHGFELQKQDLPFLFLGRDQLQVAGGQTANVPVQFNTTGLQPGMHQGQVLVICLTCRNEPTCTQDRETLVVILNVPANPPPPVNPTATPDVQPPDNAGTGAARDIPREKTPIVNAVSDGFEKGPCPQLATDCEKLRLIAAEKEAAAADAAKRASDAGTAAANADAKAKAAEDAAKKAADLVTAEGKPTAIVNGEGYTEADSDYLETLRKRNQDAYLSGQISAEEYQRRAKELDTKKAREERLAEQARLKKEADEAKAKADAERAAADKAKADADAAHAAANAAKAAADAALEEYKRCLKQVEDECLRAAAEKKKQEDAAAAAAAAAAAEAKRKQDEEARIKAQQEEIDYLLDNFKRLGLITHLPNTSIPDPLDGAFDALQKLTGKTIRDFLQSVAGQVGGGPIDPSYITGLGEAYKAMAALFSLRTKAGLERVHRLLTTKIINPNTGKVYTEDQAWNKIRRMELLMDKIKAKLAEAGK